MFIEWLERTQYQFVVNILLRVRSLYIGGNIENVSRMPQWKTSARTTNEFVFAIRTYKKIANEYYERHIVSLYNNI